MEQAHEYDRHHVPEHHREGFSGSHISLDGVK
jgi:hypothetical protein